MSNLEEDKQGLIDLIIWYRDEYHKKDFGHNNLIDQVKLANSTDDLSNVEKIVDGWLE